MRLLLTCSHASMRLLGAQQDAVKPAKQARAAAVPTRLAAHDCAVTHATTY